MQRHHVIPVWFFVGVLLAIYGILICASGINEWSTPSNTILAEYHAPVWWGGLLALIGFAYAISFRPRP